MKHSINKDTKIYCSFSQTAGNKGCIFFNTAFEKYGIDAIYKSFSVSDISDAISAAITLKFSGWAIAMPFKRPAVELLDNLDVSVLKCNAVNTVVFNHEADQTTGYNTDYYGAKKLLSPYQTDYSEIHILGNGGLSQAVQVASMDLGFKINLITRRNWKELQSLQNCLIYNCTPLSITLDKPNCYIDCLIGTETGNLLHKYQAQKQFKLYTGIDYED